MRGVSAGPPESNFEKFPGGITITEGGWESRPGVLLQGREILWGARAGAWGCGCGLDRDRRRGRPAPGRGGGKWGWWTPGGQGRGLRQGQARGAGTGRCLWVRLQDGGKTGKPMGRGPKG